MMGPSKSGMCRTSSHFSPAQPSSFVPQIPDGNFLASEPTVS